MPPLWRKAFDAIEQPLAAGLETWVQSEAFMDLTAITFRVQRRMLSDVQQATERSLHLLGWVSRGDVIRLTNQVAELERQVREVRRVADQRETPLLNGSGAGERRRRQQRTRRSSTRQGH
jgi:hypothetical protein